MFHDRELWKFINTFAPWFSAAGTITAVVVSLYLAQRDRRIGLSVVAGIRRIIERGVNRPPYFSLEVTNIGRRPAQIVSLYMKDGFYFAVGNFEIGRRLLMVAPDDALSARVPATITDGERSDYLMPWPDFERVNGDSMRRLFGGPFGRLRARLFRMGVVTSAGGAFYARIEKGLAENLVRVARTRHAGRA